MSLTPGEAARPEVKPWQSGLAPLFIGLFLWIAFFDQVGRRTLSSGGLGWSLLGVLAAGPLGYLLLYRVPALWGQGTGKPLAAVGAATFGARGSALVPGLLIGVAQVVLFAVATGYGVDLTLNGLALGDFLEPRVLRPVAIGGTVLRSPLFLATALVWCVAAALVGGWFVRWIAALMQIFPIFPAVMLAGSMLAMLGGLTGFHPIGIDGLTGEPVAPDMAGPRAFLLTIQAMFAFTAMAGVASADWGAASPSARDVRLGGWVGVGLAPVVVATLALLAVAGHQGSRNAPFEEPAPGRAVSRIADLPAAAAPDTDAAPTPVEAPAYTFRAVLMDGFGGRMACAMLMTFGLASLAPACYASFVFGHRFAAIGPGINRATWVLIGAVAAWFLIVGGWFDRTDAVFGILGAAFAPVAGAMAADASRHKDRWPGARRGINLAGLVAWALGLAVGLVPLIGRAAGIGLLERFQPASVWAFAIAFASYRVLARLGLESGPEPDAMAGSTLGAPARA